MKFKFPAFIERMMKPKTINLFAGISIHNNVIKVVKLGKENDELICLQAAEYSIDSYENITAELSGLIKDFDLEGVPTTLVIPSDKTESVQIDLSELPESDISAALPWKLKDLVSIPAQDMICDYIEMKIQPLGQSEKALIIATSRQYIENLVKPFHDANVPLIGITTEQFGLARMQSTQDAAQLAFVQHRDSDAILLILKNREICFARKIRGTNTVVDMLPEQVREMGADMIAVEIQRSIDYYESQLKQPPIKNALVAMAGNNDHLLVESLNSSLPVRAQMMPIEQIKDVSGSLSLAYLAAIGGAMYTVQEVTAE